MLHELERKIAAAVGDGLKGRTHLSVVQAPSPASPPAAGKGMACVSLTGVVAESVFERGLVAFGGGAAATSRRVVPLEFTAHVRFFFTPRDSSPGGVADGRNLLLEDMSLVVHGLGGEEPRTGEAFRTAADSGFEVGSFELRKGRIGEELNEGTLRGELCYGGRATIWPPGVQTPEGRIDAVHPLLAALPVAVTTDEPSARAGTTVNVRVGPLRGRRLGAAQDGLKLAVTVLSDAPEAQRGTITSGTEGTERGVRIIPTGEAETVITYRAPASGIGAGRIEYVAVHLATPEGLSGLFLGSTALRLSQ